MCKEMSVKLIDFEAKENIWNEREMELSAQSTSSVKDHDDETKNALLSASQITTLFNKIDGIPIPFPLPFQFQFPNVGIQDSDHLQKLFYIVDNVNKLLHQITLLSHSNQDLLSAISKQTLEVDHLKGELQTMEENSRFKLMETQRAKEELKNRVKLLEEYIENRTDNKVQERASLPGSEISEVEDQACLFPSFICLMSSPVGKVGLPLVPSAAQVRSLRKRSNDQLAITIDSESNCLLNKSQSFEDKGLVPVQGKMIADRLDGIWVSGDRTLMSRPRARLSLIAYWLVLHLWVLGTIL
ncbi:hypothetical protein LXL04_020715 [Taraxacum kok-saghyz]